MPEKESPELQEYFKDEANVHQFQVEYELCWKDQKSKKDEALARLKLYNNQRREKKAVGDTTVFTIFQTVLASLYDDRLMSEWIGKTEGDEEVATNLDVLADNDYDEMQKNEIDYLWDWDTLFFGRGILAFHEFLRDPDKNLYLPMPEVIDPASFLHDPEADAINATKFAKSSARFMGREIRMTRAEIENHPNFFNSIDWNNLRYDNGVDIKSVMNDAKQARADAQGRDYSNLKSEGSLGVNAGYILTEWYSHIKEPAGKVVKVKLWLANGRTKVIGAKILSDWDENWQLVDRTLYPTAHDWDGTSILDLTEDKQRGRAVAQNLAKELMLSDLHGTYLFDQDKISNRKDLSIGMDKFIPANNPDANTIMPVNKVNPNLGLLDFIYQSLDASAQKATATPELQQGAITSQQRTLGELNLVASSVDTRYSLSAKIFGWSEKRFWLQWYKLYKDNFSDGIDEKVLRLVGAFGAKWRPLRRENIIATIDPDVKIESKNVSRALQIEERNALANYFSFALQDPTVNRRYAAKLLGKAFGISKEKLDFLFPQTIDERVAEKQNELLSQNKKVGVKPEDDHNVHLEIHKKAGDTPATFAHITAHEYALMVKKTNPEFFPQDQQQNQVTQFGNQQTKPQQGMPQSRQQLQPSNTSGQPQTLVQ